MQVTDWQPSVLHHTSETAVAENVGFGELGLDRYPRCSDIICPGLARAALKLEAMNITGLSKF